MTSRKKETRSVYLAFEFDKDRHRRDAFMAQAKRYCDFDLQDCSLPEEQKVNEWRQQAEPLIEQSDVLLVLLGQDTHKANGVFDEMSLAGGRDGCPIIQLLPQKRKYGRVSDNQAVMRTKWKKLNRMLVNPKAYAANLRRLGWPR